jgi:hypothetical protein
VGSISALRVCIGYPETFLMRRERHAMSRTPQQEQRQLPSFGPEGSTRHHRLPDNPACLSSRCHFVTTTRAPEKLLELARVSQLLSSSFGQPLEARSADARREKNLGWRQTHAPNTPKHDYCRTVCREEPERRTQKTDCWSDCQGRVIDPDLVAFLQNGRYRTGQASARCHR